MDMMSNKDREKLFSLISKKKTKDGYFEISAIVNTIEDMIKDATMSGVWDCIDLLSVNHELASIELRSRFAPASLEETCAS